MIRWDSGPRSYRRTSAAGGTVEVVGGIGVEDGEVFRVRRRLPCPCRG